MAKSHISNGKKNIFTLNSKSVYTHILKPESVPAGLEYIDTNVLLAEVPDNTLETILMGDTLDYVTYQECIGILDGIIAKLENGGRIIIQAADIYQLCCAVAFSDMDIDTLKLVLFGGKQNMFTNYQISEEIESRGLKIVEKRFVNMFEYYIKAIKI